MLNMYADQAHLVKKQPAKAKQPATTDPSFFTSKTQKRTRVQSTEQQSVTVRTPCTVKNNGKALVNSWYPVFKSNHSCHSQFCRQTFLGFNLHQQHQHHHLHQHHHRHPPHHHHFTTPTSSTTALCSTSFNHFCPHTSGTVLYTTEQQQRLCYLHLHLFPQCVPQILVRRIVWLFWRVFVPFVVRIGATFNNTHGRLCL